jgi:prepilin-type N-terminal cleavage/methylation domain-containing protein
MTVRRNAFTLVEVLLASSILAIVLMVGLSVMMLCVNTLYDGQIESKNRINLMDNLYYITREIQSAEAIKVSNDSKVLKIKQFGSSDYSLVYSITKKYPTSEFCFKEKKMFDIAYEASNFIVDGNKIKLYLSVYKNNLDLKTVPKIIEFEITPRSTNVMIEEGE